MTTALSDAPHLPLAAPLYQTDSGRLYHGEPNLTHRICSLARRLQLTRRMRTCQPVKSSSSLLASPVSLPPSPACPPSHCLACHLCQSRAQVYFCLSCLPSRSHRSSWQDVRLPLPSAPRTRADLGLTVAFSSCRHVSRSVERYLRWLGVRTEGESSSYAVFGEQRRDCLARTSSSVLPMTRLLLRTVFSLGDHRRRMLGPSANLPPDYFSPDKRSPETDELRTKVRVTLEEEVARYFKDNLGQVAIYDANVRARVAGQRRAARASRGERSD